MADVRSPTLGANQIGLCIVVGIYSPCVSIVLSIALGDANLPRTAVEIKASIFISLSTFLNDTVCLAAAGWN